MLTILSPAKSLDMETKLETKNFSTTEFLSDSWELIQELRQKSPNEISALMGISDNLGELNSERYLEWEKPTKIGPETRQAILAFDGDVYKGMQAKEKFSEADYEYSQVSLRILSGLHGLLKPLDLIRPYRLEMGTKVKIGSHNNLYQFWGHKINSAIETAVSESPGEKVLINLASNEYFKAAKPDDLAVDTISPRFLDSKDGGDYKIVSFFAKKARGSMASWLITNRVEKVSNIKEFDGMGYSYSIKESTELTPVFKRENRTN